MCSTFYKKKKNRVELDELVELHKLFIAVLVLISALWSPEIEYF